MKSEPQLVEGSPNQEACRIQDTQTQKGIEGNDHALA